MAKRKNRLKSIQHETRQIEMIKTLEPNATPFNLQPMSNTLLAIAVTCLEGVYALEDDQDKEKVDFEAIYSNVKRLASMLAIDLT